MLIGIVAFGTSGYYFVEHMPLFEAFYMTIITISTVGYAEVVPLTQAGRALTIVIIIVAIKKMAGNMIFNPMPSETLECGDVIVVIGKKEDLKRMRAVM